MKIDSDLLEQIDPLAEDIVRILSASVQCDEMCSPGAPGDANGDGKINVNDISYVLFRLGTV